MLVTHILFRRTHVIGKAQLPHGLEIVIRNINTASCCAKCFSVQNVRSFNIGASLSLKFMKNWKTIVNLESHSSGPSVLLT